MNLSDTAYQASHRCQYSYMPQWGGTSDDGINANKPEEQPAEFQVDMAQPLKDCFAAYGAGNYVDMIGSVVDRGSPCTVILITSPQRLLAVWHGQRWVKLSMSTYPRL